MKQALYELITSSVGGTSIVDFKGSRQAARAAARALDKAKDGSRKFGQTTRVRFIKSL